MIQATAPAKIILLGEHAVVYGQPAVAIPVSGLRATAVADFNTPGSGLQIVLSDTEMILRVKIQAETIDHPLSLIASQILSLLNEPPPDLTITVKSEIPIASGLGSGAAISAVVGRVLSSALHHPLDNAQLNDIVYQVEKLYHGTPSGIDNTVIVHEHPVYFVKDQSIDFFSVKGRFHFLIADTGISALTRIAVGDVNKLYKDHPEHYQSIFESIGSLVKQARTALENGNKAELGFLMNKNHDFLKELTVSSPELDHLVDAAQKAGAFGAKLSGGGCGGNMIALVPTETLPAVRSALFEAGAVRVFETILE
jgi:mevalonate kinase